MCLSSSTKTNSRLLLCVEPTVDINSSHLAMNLVAELTERSTCPSLAPPQKTPTILTETKNDEFIDVRSSTSFFIVEVDGSFDESKPPFHGSFHHFHGNFHYFHRSFHGFRKASLEAFTISLKACITST